jgi:mutual gliding-motility protein MglA
MVMMNHATREITMKIVYYGPGLCGKTTNLEYIYETATPEKKGKLLTVATETDRTLFFDFLPMELGTVKGMKLRVQLYTVPGQVFYDATRRIVLRGSDGLVFVADSQKLMMDANIESLENLITNLKLNSIDSENIPLVFQYNKIDLPGVADQAALDKALNWRNAPSFQSVAIKGTGVNETLKKIIELVIRRIHDQEEVLKSSKTGEKKIVEASVPAPAVLPPPVLEAVPEEMPAEQEPFPLESTAISGAKGLPQEAPEEIEMEVIEEDSGEKPEEDLMTPGAGPALPPEQGRTFMEEDRFESAALQRDDQDRQSELENLVASIGLLQEKLLAALNEVDQLKEKIVAMKDGK